MPIYGALPPRPSSAEVSARAAANIASRTAPPRHRGLRDAINGTFMFFFIVLTGFITNIMQLVVFVLVRPLHRNLGRNINAHLVDLHWGLLVYLFAEWGGVNLHLYGEDVPMRATAIGHMNHRSDIDWVLGFAYAWNRRSLGRMKIVMKSDFRFVPVLGWTMLMSEFVFPYRDWTRDETLFARALDSLKDFPNPSWMVIFPEGTRCTPAKLVKSCEYARANGLPVFENILLPRTKGWKVIVKTLRDKLDNRLVDATLAFPGREPTVIDLFCGTGQVDAYMHMNWRDVSDMPRDDEGMEKWLYTNWAEKEKIVAYVKDHGHMPPTVPLVRTHVGSDTRTLFHGWLVALSILFALSPLVVPPAVLLAWFTVSVVVTVGTAGGVYLVLLQRNTKHTRSAAGSKSTEKGKGEAEGRRAEGEGKETKR